MEKNQGSYIEFTGFLELLTDIIFHLQQSEPEEGVEGIGSHKHARAVIIACALAVESCANCLLEQSGLPHQTIEGLQKAPSVSKIYVFVRLKTNNKKFLDRSSGRVGKMVELNLIRNEFVHPKRRKENSDFGVTSFSDEKIVLSFDYERSFHAQMKIPKTGIDWRHCHARSAAEASFDFFDFLFRELLSLDVGEFYHQFGSRVIGVTDSGNRIVASGAVDEYDELFCWAKGNGLRTGFLWSPLTMRGTKEGSEN